MSGSERAEVEAVYRAEFGTVVAFLAARFRDLDLPEDISQEAQMLGAPQEPGAVVTSVTDERLRTQTDQ